MTSRPANLNQINQALQIIRSLDDEEFEALFPRSEGEIRKYYILFSFGKRYVVVGCRHIQHAFNKANKEFGTEWTSIVSNPPEKYKKLGAKEMRKWLNQIQR